MVELLMVIILVGVFSALAATQFLDFRKEGRIASIKQNLAMMRTAIKNQTQQAILRCGYTIANVNSGDLFYRLGWNMIYNDNTYYAGNPTTRLCTAAQVTSATDRKFFNIDPSERAQLYIGGVYFGLNLFVPKNPFSVTGPGVDTVNEIALFSGGYISSQGGSCNVANLYVGDILLQWLYNISTGEIWAGSNTAGINECNF
jgi:type II secretory pathway pseudopilin PulG